MVSSETADTASATIAAGASEPAWRTSAERSASDVATCSTSPERIPVRCPRGSSTRSTTSMRSWCISRCMATTRFLAPNRHAMESPVNNTASTPTQISNCVALPVPTALSMITPISTGTSASDSWWRHSSSTPAVMRPRLRLNARRSRRPLVSVANRTPGIVS
jgi:hypothetical protein